MTSQSIRLTIGNDGSIRWRFSKKSTKITILFDDTRRMTMTIIEPGVHEGGRGGYTTEITKGQGLIFCACGGGGKV